MTETLCSRSRPEFYWVRVTTGNTKYKVKTDQRKLCVGDDREVW